MKLLAIFRPLGCLLSLVGAGIIITGGAIAVSALAGMYGHALSADALEQPAMSEEETSAAMIRGVVIGAVGVPLIVVGSVLLKASFMRSFARILSRSHAGGTPGSTGGSAGSSAGVSADQDLLDQLTREIEQEQR